MVVKLQKCPRAAAATPFGYERAALAVPFRYGAANRSRDVPGWSAPRGPLRPRRRAFTELLAANLLQQSSDRSSEDLPQVTVRDLVTHQRLQLSQLSVELAVCGEANGVSLMP